MAPDATERSPSPFPGRGGIAVIVLTLLALLVLVGPRAGLDPAWVEVDPGPDVDAYLEAAEAGVSGIRPGDRKSVVWLDPEARGRTAVAIVYLHGFSADRHEVEPLVSRLAADLEANVYFARLRGHGRDGAALGEATAEAWLADAAEAVAIGARIGERVLLMGTSTGGTLALWAASRPESEGRVDALALVSPHLGLRDPTARVLHWPWGGLLARLIVGPERCFEPLNAAQARHWTPCYPTRALVRLAGLVGHVRGLDLGAVEAPTWIAYAPEDRVVDPARTLRMAPFIGSRGATLHPVEGADDPEQHVVAGEIMSPSTTTEVYEAILAFWRDVDAR